jgi:hypothetical protein
MKEWGWTNPVLADEEGGVIAGHARILAARQLGITEVPVMVARGWTDAQKRAYVIADNQLGAPRRHPRWRAWLCRSSSPSSPSGRAPRCPSRHPAPDVRAARIVAGGDRSAPPLWVGPRWNVRKGSEAAVADQRMC